ncbi:response regulator transcription factor [Tabrizicola soli]|uniref:Response regulator n=1 Tax=Tabrizicola soli TaxID=2185115 RepID=A0ABV7DWB3_9RHOB|nr:response regulator transcription factor [Tabrizicola soli]
MSEFIDVLIADDHILVAEAVAHILLREGDFVARTTRCLDEVLAALGEQSFSLVLLDLMMPGMDGLPSIAQVIAAANGAKVVLFSGNVSTEFALKSVNAGAAGYIPKTMPLRSLPAALRLVCSGEVFLPAGSAEGPPQGQGAEARPVLNALQAQIMKLVQEGRTNKEIARALESTEMAVKMHLRTIFAKLQARNRAHAVTIAQGVGLI